MFGLRLSILALLILGSTSAVGVASPLQLEEPAAPFTPRTARSESDIDRVEALALFAEGRMLEQRNESAAALRKFQRAQRRDPQSAAILRELIPTAFALNRNAEAVRYAAKFADLDGGDPALLRRLGVVLTEQGEWKQAVKLYDKVQHLEATGKPNSGQIMLRMELGRLLFLLDEPQRAAEQFEQVLTAIKQPADWGLSERQLTALRGEKGAGLELIYTVLAEAKRYDPALVALDQLGPLLNNSASLAYLRADLAARRKEYVAAETVLSEYFNARETNRGLAPYELLREILAAGNRQAELLDRLQKQSAEQPANIPLRFALAEELRRTGKTAAAIPHYQSVLESSPAAEVYRGLIRCHLELNQPDELPALLGQLAAKTGTLEAATEANPARGDIPADPAPLTDEKIIGLVIETTLRQYDGSKPGHAGPLRAAGILAMRKKDYAAAATAYDRAMLAKPADKAEILLSYGLDLLATEQTADAVRVLRRGIDEKALPDSNPAFHYYLSGALAVDKQYDAALDFAQQALAKQPNQPRLAARIAWVSYFARRLPAADQAYRQLITKYDENHESSEVRTLLRDARLSLSNIAVLQGDLPAAEEWLEQVLDEFPDDIGAANDLGYLWADQNKRLERSLRMIEAAVAAEPENPAYNDSLGWVLYRLGRYEAALAAQLKAVKGEKADAVDGVVLDHLADIYAKLNRRQDALTTRRRAVQALEKSDEQRKIESVRAKLMAEEAAGN